MEEISYGWHLISSSIIMSIQGPGEKKQTITGAKIRE